MSTENEAILEKMAKLTDAVVANGGTAGLNKEALLADFTKLLDEQRIAILDSIPVRAGEYAGDPKVQKAAANYTGKYARELKDIVRNGEHKIGNWRLRGSDLLMAKILLDKNHTYKPEDTKPASADLNAVVKVMTATGSATGDELVPTGMASELWNDFFLASRVAGDLPSTPMPTDPFDVPLGLGDITWRKGGEGVAVTSQNLATAKSTLTATEQLCEVDWSYNLDEDAVIAMMPAIRQRLSLSGAEQMDAFCLNADSTTTANTNINLIDDTPAADAYYLTAGQDGIRHQYITDHAGQAKSAAGAAITDALLASMLGYLGKYGLDYNNLRLVPDAATYLTMLAITNVATADKYGPSATILKGELGKYRGIPIIPSASMSLTNNAGKVSKTAATNAYGALAAYNRFGWRVGFRRGLMIEVDRNIQTRQLIMVVSFRIAIAAYGTRSSVEHTAGMYYILV